MKEYIALLRNNKNYRFLWFGNVISLLGDWFNLIASAELITDLTNSGVAISSLFLARFLPLFLFSPLAGVLADRYSRRTIMIVSDLLRAVTVVGFLLVRSPNQVWLLYLLSILQFTLSALFTPAKSAILANVVKRKDLVTANALDSLTWSTMLALGAFLGGLVAVIFGSDIAFLADAATFLLSAWAISQISVTLHDESRSTVAQGGWLAFIDGFRYLRREPFILVVSLVKGAGSLVWGAINVLEISIADEIFPISHPFLEQVLKIKDGGTATLGIIYVMSGIGTGLGPLLMREWLGDRPSRLLLGISFGFVLMVGGIWGLSVASTLPILLLITIVRTIGTGTLWVFAAALLQMSVPDRFRGRVFAFEFTVLTLTQSLSIFVAGFAQDSWGMSVQKVAAMMSVLGLVISCMWFLFYLRSSSRVNEMGITETTT